MPIRPWGVQAFASESGTSSESTTVFVGLPAGRTYESPEMLIVVSPTPRADAHRAGAGRRRVSRCCEPSTHESQPGGSAIRRPITTADRAADLLAATSALAISAQAPALPAAAPEAQRLTQRIQGLVASIVSAQNQDGGWPWVSGESTPRPGQNAPACRPATA